MAGDALEVAAIWSVSCNLARAPRLLEPKRYDRLHSQEMTEASARIAAPETGEASYLAPAHLRLLQRRMRAVKKFRGPNSDEHHVVQALGLQCLGFRA